MSQIIILQIEVEIDIDGLLSFSLLSFLVVLVVFEYEYEWVVDLIFFGLEVILENSRFDIFFWKQRSLW